MNDLSLNEQREAVFEDYAAGRLSPAKHALISEFGRINPEAGKALAFEDAVAGTLLEAAEMVSMSDDFFAKVSGALPDMSIEAPETVPDVQALLANVKWRSRLPGISTHDIIGHSKSDEDRLYLLKMRAGMGVWEHSHTGDEWVLVLKGEYSSEGESFSPGDLHMEDASSVHSLKAGNSEDCVCLVVTQGPVKMKSVLGKILTPIVGM